MIGLQPDPENIMKTQRKDRDRERERKRKRRRVRETDREKEGEKTPNEYKCILNIPHVHSELTQGCDKDHHGREGEHGQEIELTSQQENKSAYLMVAGSKE